MCSTRVGDVADDRDERAGRRADRGVAHQDPEAVGGLLDVVEQRAARPAPAARAGARAVSDVAHHRRAAGAPRGRRRRRTGPPCRRSARRRPAWRPRRGRRSPRSRCRRSRARRTAPRAISISCSRRSAPVIRRARPRLRLACGAPVGRHAALGQSAGSRRSLRVEALLDRPAHVVHPADLLDQPDDPGRGVDLAAQHAVPGAGRVGVVQVVPGLAHRRDREPPDVARTCRGDLNGRSPTAWQIELIDQVTWCSRRDPHQRAPEERGHRALPRHRDQAADDGRQRAARPTTNQRELRARSGRCRGPSAGRARTCAARSARCRTASPCARSKRPLISAADASSP